MITLGQVKGICARALSKRQSATELLSYINRAQERLLHEGKWKNTYGRYRVCVSDSILTWPREIEAIEAWAVCDWPGQIRSGWYEFVESGPGLLEGTDCNGDQLIDRGNACSYDDPDGGASKVFSIYSEVAETTTSPFILQFYDFNGRWVRTQYGGSWIDGEAIGISNTAGQYSHGTRSIAEDGLVRLIKPVTNGRIYLFERDTSTGIYKGLGVYQPGETVPEYRRSMIPGLSNIATSDDPISVTVVGKLRHIDVVADNDFLIIDMADALRLECQAIYKEENNLMQEARDYHARALELLDNQLSHWNGGGMTTPIKMAPSTVWGGGIEQAQ